MIKKKTTGKRAAKPAKKPVAMAKLQDKKKAVATASTEKQPGKLGRVLLRLVYFTVFIVVLSAALILGGIIGYREYLSFKQTFVDMEASLTEVRTERDLLRTEIDSLEERLQLTEKNAEERFAVFDKAFDQLNSRASFIRRLESFVYLAERERVISRSPRRVRDLLLQARDDLKDSPGNVELLDALDRDLAAYENLAGKGTEAIFYQLRILSNQTGELKFVPSSSAADDANTDTAQSGWRSWASVLGDYVRIYKYEQDERSAFFRDRSSLDLVKLLLEVHLMQAERSFRLGEEQLYLASLNQYLANLRRYYPPNSHRFALESRAEELKSLDFPSLPALNVVRILPQQR